MTAKEIVICLSQQVGITQAQLAERLGLKGRANIANKLARNDGMKMSIETFIQWMDELDAQVVVQPLNGEDDFILDGDDEGVTYK